MLPFLRTFLPRRGSATTLLPSTQKSNVRLLTFIVLLATTTFAFYAITHEHGRTSILNRQGLWWSPGAESGLASLSITDLNLGYRIFPAGGQGWEKDQLKLTREVPILDDECLERWVGRGEPCSKDSFNDPVVVDIVWTWVNGSDPLWHEQFSHYTSIANLPKGQSDPVPFKHFRNKQELQHSLRAALQAMSGRIRTFHLVLGDWELASIDREEVLWKLGMKDKGQDWRVGQIPTWLERELIGVGPEEGVRVEVHHHSDVFRDRTGEGEEWEERRFRENALPTFNSFAIESNLVNIPGLADNFIYLNDEFFLTRAHSLTDWVHPLFGPILRLALPGWIEPEEEYPATSCPHELSGLIRSNWLMGRRFGPRKRASMEHIGKLLSTPILQELAIIWSPDFARSVPRRFREIERGVSDASRAGDLHASWFGPLFLVERAREAMLWSWAVARLGGIDGMWGAEERNEVRRVLKIEGMAEEPKNVWVDAYSREKRPGMGWMDLKGNLDEMGVDGPMVTEMLWSSLDGPLPNGPGFYYSACTIPLEKCFDPSWWSGETDSISATDAFTRLAFQQPQCGDCILQSLVASSGPRGLSSLLPLATSETYHPTNASSHLITQPHMPLTPLWNETDFSLSNVVRGKQRTWRSKGAEVDLRTWCLRLIARYQYTEGRSNFAFTMMKHPQDVLDAAQKLRDDPGVSTLVMNDDLEGTEQAQELTIKRMKSWLEAKWPTKGPWERTSSPSDSDENENENPEDEDDDV